MATQTRSKATVDAILSAAGSILEKDGYRAASTNAIARRAGVSVGSLYQYFSCREDIFRTLLERHHDAIHPIVSASLKRLSTDRTRPSRVLEEMLEDLLTAHTGRPNLMRALEHELTQIRTRKERHEEAEEKSAATQILASRIHQPIAQALASAWLATEITAMVSRKLAHDAPDWLDPKEVQIAFARMMRALVG